MISIFRNNVSPKLYKKVKLWIWANTDWVSYKSYSGEGEDMILRKIFFKNHMGFYIDIGAYHPKKSSNTYFFYKKGWKGINIDAMPGSMKLFRDIRKRDINLELPLGIEGQEVNYYEFEDKALNGFESPKLIQKNPSKVQNKLKRIHRFKTRALNNILEEYLPMGQEIDFLTIDVEGQEFTILENFNFNKYSPKWILVEIWGFSIENNSHCKVTSLLKSNGYIASAKTINTVFFEKK